MKIRRLKWLISGENRGVEQNKTSRNRHQVNESLKAYRK